MWPPIVFDLRAIAGTSVTAWLPLIGAVAVYLAL